MAAEKQTNYTIMEGYELPSGGQIYDVPVNPHIELRAMTARDEMKRTASSTTPYKTLADIIEGCMLEKPAISVYDMALGDYEYLLHKLRIVTYGDEYKIEVGCPFCGKTTETVAHLDELELKEFDAQKFKEQCTIVLPGCKDTIELRIQTPRILDMIERTQKDMKRKYSQAEIDFEMLATMLHSIVRINGNPIEHNRLEDYIFKLPAKDLLKLVNRIRELNSSLGLRNELYVQCSNCGQDIKTFFRFGPEFFRPTTV